MSNRGYGLLGFPDCQKKHQQSFTIAGVFKLLLRLIIAENQATCITFGSEQSDKVIKQIIRKCLSATGLGSLWLLIPTIIGLIKAQHFC